MNLERFHNELAMRLGYERIVKDKRIQISVEESNDPWVTLKIDGYDDIKFKASDKTVAKNMNVSPDTKNEIESIICATHQAYITSVNSKF